jgi:hypothetical protein
MRLVGIQEAIDLELDAVTEPDVRARVEDLAQGGFYDGARLPVKADTPAVELARAPPFKQGKHGASGITGTWWAP